MKINVLLSILVAHFLLGCMGQPEKSKDNLAVESTQASNESSLSGVKDDYEIIETSIIGDTLRIVSLSDFFYFPFGYYAGADEFLERYPFMEKVEQQYDCYGDGSDMATLYRFSFNNSFVKFLHDTEENRLMLVSGRITDKNISLVNQVKVGLAKTDFIGMFTNEIKPEQLKNVSVIEFASGLTGIWHYYCFENDILTSIYIDTDYLLDKS